MEGEGGRGARQKRRDGREWGEKVSDKEDGRERGKAEGWERRREEMER